MIHDSLESPDRVACFWFMLGLNWAISPGVPKNDFECIPYEECVRIVCMRTYLPSLLCAVWRPGRVNLSVQSTCQSAGRVNLSVNQSSSVYLLLRACRVLVSQSVGAGRCRLYTMPC